jgi:hypothetical protein
MAYVNVCEIGHKNSIGVEWETRLCVFDPKHELKDLKKIPLISQLDNQEYKNKDGWSITLEKDSNLPSCLHIIEGQIGISCSNDEYTFNKKQLKDQIKSFSSFFNSIIKNGNINIRGIDYPIIERNDEIYCKGLPDKLKMKNNDVIGKPQITFGIDLKYIYKLFTFISKKYEDIITQYDLLEYHSFYKYYKIINETVKDVINFLNLSGNIHEMSKINLDIAGFLCLCFYKKITELNVIIDDPFNKRNIYFKAFFILKNRTNLKDLYDYLNLKYTNNYYLNLPIIKEFIITNDAKKIIDIEEWSYPIEDNYNIFIELRDVRKFILVCNKNFYLYPRINTTLSQIELQDPFYFSQIIGQLKVTLDNLYLYCEAFMDILKEVTDTNVNFLKPGIPLWSFKKTKKKDKLKNKNK